MLWSHLNERDWQEFNTLHPGAWDWLTGRLLLREAEHLRQLSARSPWQEKRLAQVLAQLELLSQPEPPPAPQP
jgi:hypothetical protein